MNIRNYSLEHIKALIVEGNDLLVITSPASSDKDLLSGQVESIKDPYWRTSLIHADANTNIESLSQEIIEQALPDQTNDNLPVVSQVHRYLEYAAHNGLLPVIMIDDAHKLSQEVLEFILQLAELRYAESLFRIILFADETINEHLDAPALKKLAAGVLHNIHTTSFAKEEIKEKPKAVINEVASIYDEIDEELLADEYALDDNEKDRSRTIIGLAVIAIVLITAFLAYSYLNKQKDVDVTESTIAIQPQELIIEETPSLVEEDDQEIAEEIQLIDEDDSNIDDEISQIEPEPLIEEDASEDISDTEITEAEDTLETPAEEVAEYVEEIEPPAIEEEAMPETMTDADDENVFNLETVPEFLQNIKGPAWIRQQPANSYVLQIISAQYKSNLRNLLSDQPGIQSQLSGYVKYTPSGKPRYLLLYGSYPDRKSAVAAINELPDKLQSIPPWPRKIADVMNELANVSEPFIEVEEGIVIPLGDYAGEIEEIESPVIEDEEDGMPETSTDTDDENIFNLDTIPDFIAGIKGPVWLRQQAAGSYVLQLLSAQYMSNIKNLLSGQSGIQNQLSGYVKYTPSGKPRYLLLYGIYPDEESAEAAIDDLPVEFQSIPPWPRRLGDAIKEINKRAEPPTNEDLSESILGYG
jgi:DamX protein